MRTSRRETVVTLACFLPLIFYAIYLLELRDSGWMIVREFGSYANLRNQVDLLYGIGRLETGVFGAGLVVTAFFYYKCGALARRLLMYSLACALMLVVLILVGLNLYYQYTINTLGSLLA